MISKRSIPQLPELNIYDYRTRFLNEVEKVHMCRGIRFVFVLKLTLESSFIEA